MDINIIHNESCLSGLKMLADNSIDCCVTSPPYFGLRDYGTSEQIGLEETPELFVQQLVNVFSQVKRVLKTEGTLWLNIGDSYSGSGKGGNNDMHTGRPLSSSGHKYSGLKNKDLIGIPWMVAFALRANGWYLRQDIIWSKPNPMPESVTDRCTKAHEYIFLLSKSNKYYYDAESIKVVAKNPEDDLRRMRQQKSENKYAATETLNGLRPRKSGNKERKSGSDRGCPEGTGSNVCSSVPWEGTKANKRSVWTVTTKPFKEAHFATFPEDLIVDCIKAGCPENGIVLDPFMGAGTTALVAKKLNRNYIGYELNADYIKIAETRIFNSIGLFAPTS
ncbi:MAG: site-specific DNA-methyltransferase [Bacteroidota bacterium]